MLNVGESAPDFQLRGDDGKEISLAGLRGRYVVLYFYPKASTPGCTCEANEFRDRKKDFDKLGAVILGCSADQVEAQARFHDKQNLNFNLLSDPEFEVIEAYGARRMKKFLGKSFLGIVRSTVLMGPDGKIAKIWETASAKGHAAEVLAALKELKKSA
ncbi:MAG: thioredoxin-dependent thiol peroxidase [Candidatus Acidiferrales bacterium]